MDTNFANFQIEISLSDPTLKTGVEIRSHSFEFEQLVLDKYKSYIAFGANVHTWLSNNNGEDFKV